MNLIQNILLSIFFLSIPCVSCFEMNFGILDKLWSNSKDHISLQSSELPNLPYELAEKDEKFLKEAAELIKSTNSELDMCHQRVIMTLSKSCQDLNAEQLGKLAVKLLNCQSYVEGRILYECNDNMSLKECTINMDTNTWNTYHLITNRAKAVCTAIRNTQFRMLTEMTVNKLMSAAHDQISLMEKLSNDQNLIKQLTEEAFKSITTKNEELFDKQNQMIQLSDVHKKHVENNIKDLFKERSLIKAGQIEVADLISSLRNKIDQSLMQLDKQTSLSKENHETLINDLKSLHKNAKAVSEQIIETTSRILDRSQEASTQYEFTLNQLQEINKTIISLSSILSGVHNDISDKLNWISNKVGSADMAINDVHLILTHIIYLILGMLILSFLKADNFSRVFFILVLPINYFATVYDLYGLDLTTLSQIIIAVLAVNVISKLYSKGYLKSFAINDKTNRFKKDFIKNPSSIPDNQEENSEEEEEDYSSNEKETSQYISFATSKNHSVAYESTLHNRSVMNNLLNRNELRSSTGSYNQHLRDSPTLTNSTNRSATPYDKTVGRNKCSATTKTGLVCKNAAVANENFCRVHWH